MRNYGIMAQQQNKRGFEMKDCFNELNKMERK